MTGHLLGAAGAIEAISVILSIKNSIVPPTINHKHADENINPSLNLTLNTAQKRDINIAMSNTFGFGGHNACVIFKKYITFINFNFFIRNIICPSNYFFNNICFWP